MPQGAEEILYPAFSFNFNKRGLHFMKHTIQALIFAVICGASLGVAAQSPSATDKPAAQPAAAVKLPAGVTEDMLAPPPVPRFMTEKQDKPLSMDEMVRQAREAEEKAGAKPAKPATDTPAPAK